MLFSVPGDYLFDAFFALTAVQHNNMRTSQAFKLDVRPRPGNKPCIASARMRFFCHNRVSNIDNHLYQPHAAARRQSYRRSRARPQIIYLFYFIINGIIIQEKNASQSHAAEHFPFQTSEDQNSEATSLLTAAPSALPLTRGMRVFIMRPLS